MQWWDLGEGPGGNKWQKEEQLAEQVKQNHAPPEPKVWIRHCRISWIAKLYYNKGRQPG